MMEAVGSAAEDAVTGARAALARERRRPLVWRHPHASGAYVVEEPSGQMLLVFERYGARAWTRRVAWRGGVYMLFPEQEPETVLSRLGYAVQDAALAQP